MRWRRGDSRELGFHCSACGFRVIPPGSCAANSYSLVYVSEDCSPLPNFVIVYAGAGAGAGACREGRKGGQVGWEFSPLGPVFPCHSARDATRSPPHGKGVESSGRGGVQRSSDVVFGGSVVRMVWVEKTGKGG